MITGDCHEYEMPRKPEPVITMHLKSNRRLDLKCMVITAFLEGKRKTTVTTGYGAGTSSSSYTYDLKISKASRYFF